MESILNLEFNEGQAALIQEALARQISHYRIKMHKSRENITDEDYLYNLY